MNVCKIRLKINYMTVLVGMFPTTGCVLILLLFVSLTWVLYEIKLNTDKVHNFRITNRSKAVVPVLFLYCVTLWFILRGASCLDLP